ncbi:MAG TPA: hypothetical protein VMM78_11085 [Thermomicrobiales bacterium]|nr:hypothetical protein [Thermomicrobiales bacterium]
MTDRGSAARRLGRLFQINVSCAVLLLAWLACGDGYRDTSVDPTATLAPLPAATRTPDTRPLPEPVLRAIARAAEDAGVPPEQVEIVEYAEQQWPSTAIGCPRPGEFYAQVITPGYRVVLRVGDETLTYHTDMDGNVRRCDQ